MDRPQTQFHYREHEQPRQQLRRDDHQRNASEGLRLLQHVGGDGTGWHDRHGLVLIPSQLQIELYALVGR